MDYSGFGLVGCRDYGYDHVTGFEWVPCASCMHPAFDRDYEVTRDFVFFGNDGMKGFEAFVPDMGLADDAMMFNRKTSVDDVAAVLGSADTVVTSSFHGVDWATLLGKRVVAIATSTKFYGLKHPVPFCSAPDWKRYLQLAVRHTGVLEECRAANTDFSAKVIDYFSSWESRSWFDLGRLTGRRS